MNQRLQNELAQLQELATVSHGRIAVSHTPDLRQFDIILNVPAPVGTSENYTVENKHVLTLEIPDDYPDSAPVPHLDRPILVPNVWPSKVPCIVAHYWTANQTLDQVVCDVIEEIQGLGPNLGSIANPIAGELFQRPAFVAKLRRQLGTPIHLVPPSRAPKSRRAPIETVSKKADGIQTVTKSNRGGIQTVRPS